MAKKIIYAFLGLLILLCIITIGGIKYVEANWFAEKALYFNYREEGKRIHFEWSSNQYGDYIEPYDAILIPFELAGFKQKFYWQFDTGAPNTTLYGNSLASLKKAGLAFHEVVMDQRSFVEEISLNLGGNPITAKSIGIVQGYGADVVEDTLLGRTSMGTIGTDFLEGRILLIDFKNQFIQLFDERPHWMRELGGFEAFDFQGRRIMLPVKMDKQEYQLLYDSGSSAFGLITSEKRYRNYSNTSQQEIRYTTTNMGKPIPICHKSTDKLIECGGESLPLQRISYVDMYAWTQQFISPFTHIGGWLGNKPFTESVLILDCKSKEFKVLAAGEFGYLEDG